MLSKRSKVSVRVHSHAYLAAAAVASFVSAYLLYLGWETAALGTVTFAVFCYPFASFFDRIVFDGKRLRRTGIPWRLLALATGRPIRVKPHRIVHVDTEATRIFRRGPNVAYFYRTSLHADDISFRVASGRGYRELISTVLPLIPDGCLDLRSLELRDHFKDAFEVRERARSLHIPAGDVLDTGTILVKPDVLSSETAPRTDSNEIERSNELRTVANQLRANGRLVQSFEAFRRAHRLMPQNARLIYEFARCLQSLAAAKHDSKLERRSRAMMRIAERRSGNDADLLSLLGETYFSVGSWRRAENAFKRAAETGNAGYRIFRGLGELALRDGKIAHAINYFARSAEVAKPPSLFRWARSEADYLRHLNDDEEYMELEIGRINLYDTFDSARSTSIKIFCFGLFVIALGLVSYENVITDIGWAVSGISLLIWLASSLLKQSFASRIPFELLDKK